MHVRAAKCAAAVAVAASVPSQRAASPSQEVATSTVKDLHDSAGYVGVRINAGLWAKKGAELDDETGRAVFGVCGDLGMSCGVLCADFAANAPAIKRLATSFPKTKIVIDHFAGLTPVCCRCPARHTRWWLGVHLGQGKEKPGRFAAFVGSIGLFLSAGIRGMAHTDRACGLPEHPRQGLWLVPARRRGVRPRDTRAAHGLRRGQAHVRHGLSMGDGRR